MDRLEEELARLPRQAGRWPEEKRREGRPEAREKRPRESSPVRVRASVCAMGLISMACIPLFQAYLLGLFLLLIALVSRVPPRRNLDSRAAAAVVAERWRKTELQTIRMVKCLA